MAYAQGGTTPWVVDERNICGQPQPAREDAGDPGGMAGGPVDVTLVQRDPSDPCGRRLRRTGAAELPNASEPLAARPMPTIHDVLQHHSPTAFAAALDQLIAAREAAVGWNGLEEEERVARCVLAFEREAADGGLAQYFASEAADHALETVGALESIGASESSALLRQGLSIFPRRMPPDELDEREEILANLSEEGSSLLGRLDSIFFDSAESITSLLREYVGESVEAFEAAD